MADTTCTQWTSGDVSQHLKCPAKIKQQKLHDASSSPATWLHLGASFLIRLTQLNGDDLHSRVLSELFIKDEEMIDQSRPYLTLFIFSLFDGKYILGCFK